ncbi:MAG: flagellar basal body-associated FliL family protein [bacterium]
MANEPTQTEIDSADDLFGGGDVEEETSAPAPGDTEQDTGLPEEPTDAPPAEEIGEADFEAGEPEYETGAEAEEDFGDEDAKSARKRPAGPSIIKYYAIPVAGAVLIMALGWSFAFIARQGLVQPEEPVKTAKAEEEKPLLPEKPLKKPKRDLRNVPIDVPQQAEKEEVLLGKEGSFIAKPAAPRPKVEPLPEPPEGKEEPPEPREAEPARPPRELASVPAPPIEEDTGEPLTVPVKYPFFIPLVGGRNGRRGRKGRKGQKPGKTVFLNFSVNLLVSNKAAASEFNSKRALIREAIYLHYSRLTPGDLSTPGRREKIRRRLVAKIDKQIIQGKVRGVLFQEFYTR